MDSLDLPPEWPVILCPEPRVPSMGQKLTESSSQPVSHLPALALGKPDYPSREGPTAVALRGTDVICGQPCFSEPRQPSEVHRPQGWRRVLYRELSIVLTAV